MQIPQVHPITGLTMNYTILVIGIFAAAGVTAWWFEGRKQFIPPGHEDTVIVLSGVDVDRDSEGSLQIDQSHAGKLPRVSAGAVPHAESSTRLSKVSKD